MVLRAQRVKNKDVGCCGCFGWFY